MPPQLQDASWDDVIRAAAKQHGVSPALALAVAKKESGVTPGAIGDRGKAIGMFQLHAGAAKDTGTADRTDPLANITGGVKYLRQLSDRYQGDVVKTLQAYNGGMDNVDKGTVSADAQAYAADVMSALSAGMRGASEPGAVTPAGGVRTPIAGRGTATQNIGTTAKANAVDFTRAYDPRTSTGRENLAGTAVSLGSAMLTRGMPVGALTTRIASFLGPVVATAAAGGAERAAEEAIGTAPAGGVAGAATRQGVMELGGQFIWRLAGRLGRTFMAPSVARNAAEGLAAKATTTREAGRDAVDLVRSQIEDVVRTQKLSTQAVVDQAKTAGTKLVAGTRQAAADKLSQLELDHAAEINTISQQYDKLVGHAPSTMGTAAAVKATVEGPSKRALDLAGQRVAEAAASGPPIDLTPVLDHVEMMVAGKRPDIVFNQAAKSDAIGFLRNAIRPAGQAAAVQGANASDQAALRKAIAQQLGVEETHPLPGLLGKLQSIENPAEVSFADAHQIKMLLDEAVNWDRTARKHLEQITKGTRIALRETMAAAGHAPYEQATAAFQAVVPLYRKGIGKQIIQLSQTPAGSARVAQMLRSNDPISARALKQLLVDQSAAGGDAATGHQAWDAVRSTYTYDKLIVGGVDKLADRIDKLLTQSPEFVKEVYGDQSGTQVLHNLGALAEAYSHAEARAAEEIATAKVSGTKAVASARVAAADHLTDISRQARESLAATQRTGAQQIRQANRQASAANKGVVAESQAFKDSSLAKFTRSTPESEAADVVRAAALGLRSYWGGLSILRLLRSPQGADLLQWAAYSPRNTQRMVNVLTSPLPPTTVSAFLKDIYHAFPSSSPAAEPSDGRK